MSAQPNVTMSGTDLWLSLTDGLRRSPAAGHPAELCVLIVSENPAFIHAAARQLQPRGIHMVACLGPVHSRCSLEDHDSCPLSERAAVALVDSPPTGTFAYQRKEIPSGTYAENLQRAHPNCSVILCGAPEGAASGEVAQAASAASALKLLCALLESRRDGFAFGACDGKE